MTPAERLKAARERQGYETAVDASRAFGWAEAVYRSHESGRRKYDFEWAETYGSAFRVRPEWLLYGRGRPNWLGVAVVSFVGAGAVVFPLEQGPRGFDLIEPPPGTPEEAFAIVVRGDSMEPALGDGDTLICVPTDVRNVVGKRAVVDLDTGARLVKRVLPGSAPGLFTLVSDNAAPVLDVRIVSAARILWIAPA